MTDVLHITDFHPFVGSDYLITDAEGGDFTVRLISTDLLPSSLGTLAARQSFSLIFLGPVQPRLPQRTYDMTNRDGARSEIFLVPIGPHQEGFQYQAVFN